MVDGLSDPAELRGALRSFLEVQAPAAPTVRTITSREADGYSHLLVEIVTADDVIPAILAVPQGSGPFPGIAVFHQHAGQRHLGKSEVFGLAGHSHQAFGPALARAGFVVIAPDSIAFEDRRPGGAGTDPRNDDWAQHYNALAYRLVVGDTLMRKVLADASAAISVLVARPDVVPSAVGALGHSYGGNTTLFLTAVDERIGFACVSGALGSYRRKIADGTGIEMAEVVPGFNSRFDLEHVLAAIAPRQCLVVSASQDPYAADAEELIELAKPAFCGAPEALSHLRVEGGHALDQDRFERIISWMVQAAATPT